MHKLMLYWQLFNNQVQIHKLQLQNPVQVQDDTLTNKRLSAAGGSRLKQLLERTHHMCGHVIKTRSRLDAEIIMHYILVREGFTKKVAVDLSDSVKTSWLLYKSKLFTLHHPILAARNLLLGGGSVKCLLSLFRLYLVSISCQFYCLLGSMWSQCFDRRTREQVWFWGFQHIRQEGTGAKKLTGFGLCLRHFISLVLALRGRLRHNMHGIWGRCTTLH